MNKEIKVSGVGCCLVDRVYNKVSFSSPQFSKYLSKKKNDGGLKPGQLIFNEEFERFIGNDISWFVKDIKDGGMPDIINIGGPGIVPLIHAAQMSVNSGCHFYFYGNGGKDQEGQHLISLLKETPVNVDNFKLDGQITPSTIVLSDPEYNNDNGERIFINSIAAANEYSYENLDDVFFDSDITVFGGTALVPPIHDNLTHLLKKAKKNGCITLVNTVYDFRNERANPFDPWPLGESNESYQNIDLLIVDYEEALRLSGKNSLDTAVEYFKINGTKSLIVTNGSENVRLYSEQGGLFEDLGDMEMPVSNTISKKLEDKNDADTTGCGDNFAGGVIYSLISQLQSGRKVLNLREACVWGIVSGGYTCFYVGGTYIENYKGEKKNLIIPYFNLYQKQLCDDD